MELFTAIRAGTSKHCDHLPTRFCNFWVLSIRSLRIFSTHSALLSSMECQWGWMSSTGPLRSALHLGLANLKPQYKSREAEVMEFDIIFSLVLFCKVPWAVSVSWQKALPLSARLYLQNSRTGLQWQIPFLISSSLWEAMTLPLLALPSSALPCPWLCKQYIY